MKEEDLAVKIEERELNTLEKSVELKPEEENQSLEENPKLESLLDKPPLNTVLLDLRIWETPICKFLLDKESVTDKEIPLV